MVNVLHDLELGKKSPEVVNAIIEIPKDSSAKYEIDKETGLLMLDRMLFSAMHYPGDYGLLPKTHCDDGDPLDVIIITGQPLLPLTLAEVRVLGVVKMIDDGEQDDKIIGVYDKDPRYEEFKDLEDIPKHRLKEIKHFFETYKELQNKKVEVKEILGKEAAIEEIKKSQQMYEKKFKQ